MKRFIPLLAICGILLVLAGVFVGRSLFGSGNRPPKNPGATNGGSIAEKDLPPRLQVALRSRVSRYTEAKAKLHRVGIDFIQTIAALDAEVRVYAIHNERNAEKAQMSVRLAARGVQSTPQNTAIVDFIQHGQIIGSAAGRFENAFNAYKAEVTAIESEFFSKYAEIYGSTPKTDEPLNPPLTDMDDELLFMLNVSSCLDCILRQLTSMSPGWETYARECISDAGL